MEDALRVPPRRHPHREESLHLGGELIRTFFAAALDGSIATRMSQLEIPGAELRIEVYEPSKDGD